MRSGACLLLLTIVWPLARAFDVSWFLMPQSNNDYYGGENEIPQPRIAPNRPSKPAYHIWTEDLYEGNRVCERFYCSRDPCCEGECIKISTIKLCIKLGYRKRSTTLQSGLHRRGHRLDARTETTSGKHTSDNNVWPLVRRWRRMSNERQARAQRRVEN